MSLDEDRVRELCRIRDAGIIASAASTSQHARSLLQDASDSELAQLVEAGAAARHELVDNGTGLVRHVIGELNVHGERADVFQEGMLAVAAAVDAFDPERGRFSTFMWSHIRGAVLQAIATESGRLHLTPGQAKDRARVMTELRHREAEGSPSSVEDLAVALNLGQERVERALAFQPHAPLPDLVKDGAEVAALSAVADDRLEVPLERYVGMLPLRERRLVEMLYGFTGSRRSSSQVADLLKCSPRTVDRLRNQAHHHLQELLEHFEGASQGARGSSAAASPVEADAPGRARGMSASGRRRTPHASRPAAPPR